MFSITVKSDMKVNILIYLSSIVGLENSKTKTVVICYVELTPCKSGRNDHFCYKLKISLRPQLFKNSNRLLDLIGAQIAGNPH